MINFRIFSPPPEESLLPLAIIPQPLTPPSSRPPPTHLLSLHIFLFWTVPISRFTEYVVRRCDWLLSLHIMLSRFIHNPGHVSTLFHFTAEYFIVWIYHMLFVHLYTDRLQIVSTFYLLWTMSLCIFTYIRTHLKKNFLFWSGFKSVTQLSRSLYAPALLCHAMPSQLSTSSTRVVHLLQSMNWHWLIITIPSPEFTLGLNLGGVHYMGLNEWIMTWIHHYSIK